jgi:hypothetical protein
LVKPSLNSSLFLVDNPKRLTGLRNYNEIKPLILSLKIQFP